MERTKRNFTPRMIGLAIASLSLGGCLADNPFGRQYLSATLVAKFVSLDGTAAVIGRVRVPKAIVSPQGGTVELLGQDLAPLPGKHKVSIDDRGRFQLQSVPANRPFLICARFTEGGKEMRLLKYLNVGRPLECVQLDLASTLIASKLVSAKPLLGNDPGLNREDAFALVDTAKLAAVEKQLGDALGEDVGFSSEELEALLSPDGADQAAKTFEGIAGSDESLSKAYGDAVDPTSTVLVGVASVALNRAPVPGVDRTDKMVFGVLNLQISAPPMALAQVDFLVDGVPVATASDPGTNWQSTFDTWKVTNGPHQLSAEGLVEGRRRILAASFVNVQNTPDKLCPEQGIAP